MNSEKISPSGETIPAEAIGFSYFARSSQENARIMSIGERIKRARIKLGLTQVGLAAIVKINQVTISKLERGITKDPRSIITLRIAEALGVTPEYLQFGTRKKQVHVTAKGMRNLVDVCKDLSPDEIAMIISLAKSFQKQH